MLHRPVLNISFLYENSLFLSLSFLSSFDRLIKLFFFFLFVFKSNHSNQQMIIREINDDDNNDVCWWFNEDLFQECDHESRFHLKSCWYCGEGVQFVILTDWNVELVSGRDQDWVFRFHWTQEWHQSKNQQCTLGCWWLNSSLMMILFWQLFQGKGKEVSAFLLHTDVLSIFQLNDQWKKQRASLTAWKEALPRDRNRLGQWTYWILCVWAQMQSGNLLWWWRI